MSSFVFSFLISIAIVFSFFFGKWHEYHATKLQMCESINDRKAYNECMKGPIK